MGRPVSGSRSERERGAPAVEGDGVANHHPTVKPCRAMRWLCRLVGGQPGSVILDPFVGSGTTAVAAVLEGYRAIGIELLPDHAAIAEARVAHAIEHPDEWADTKPGATAARKG